MSGKLCYVLPEYDEATSEHYYHLYEFIEGIARHTPVYLVVEKASRQPGFRNMAGVRTLKVRAPLVNILEKLFLFARLRLKGYDAFYVHYSYSSAIAAALVTRLLGGNTLYWHCNLKKDFMVGRPASWRALGTKLLDDYPFLLSLRLVNRLVTGSKYMKDYYAASFGVSTEKIRVMPNWVNLGRFNPAAHDRAQARQALRLREEARVVLFVHWLAPRKGPQHLVEIARRVCREVPGAVFLVVGEGPYRETLEREVRVGGLDGVIRLAGAVPNQEICRYYAAADLFIMPSQEEGFPRVLIEAMAMGVPFVATDVGSVKEITTELQRTGVVPAGRVQDFAERVVQLLNNDDLRQRLAVAGLKRVQDFSYEKVAGVFRTHTGIAG